MANHFNVKATISFKRLKKSRTISANTLFHFTSSSKVLEDILTDDFYPRYSLETFNYLPKGTEKEIAIPMVSFCDIPLSQVVDHASRYGHYAIGLKKEWGRAKRVTPVVYTYSGSPLPDAIKRLFDEYEKNYRDNDSLVHAIHTLSVYLKPYEGKNWRNGSYSSNKIRFYDEREWRYVPTPEQFDEAGCMPDRVLLRKNDFLDQRIRNEANQRIQTCRLGFTPDDIKYLIVARESEIREFIERVREIKVKYDDKAVDLLITRLISMEQIREDF